MNAADQGVPEQEFVGQFPASKYAFTRSRTSVSHSDCPAKNSYSARATSTTGPPPAGNGAVTASPSGAVGFSSVQQYVLPGQSPARHWPERERVTHRAWPQAQDHAG